MIVDTPDGRTAKATDLPRSYKCTVKSSFSILGTFNNDDDDDDQKAGILPEACTVDHKLQLLAFDKPTFAW